MVHSRSSCQVGSAPVANVAQACFSLSVAQVRHRCAKTQPASKTKEASCFETCWEEASYSIPAVAKRSWTASEPWEMTH